MGPNNNMGAGTLAPTWAQRVLENSPQHRPKQQSGCRKTCPSMGPNNNIGAENNTPFHPPYHGSQAIIWLQTNPCTMGPSSAIDPGNLLGPDGLRCDYSQMYILAHPTWTFH